MGFFNLFKKKRNEEVYVPFELTSTKEGSFERFYSKLLKKSLILLIVGKRGSGKTALGMKFLELFNKRTKEKCYILGYENINLPRWIIKVNDVKEAANNSVILIDEGAITFSARESMKETNKEIGRIMTIARHKNLSLIFISQNSAMIDLNILRLADTIILKEPSLLQAKFERRALKEMYEEIHKAFKERQDKNAYFYIWDDDFQGMMRFDLPVFWEESISKSFRNK